MNRINLNDNQMEEITIATEDEDEHHFQSKSALIEHIIHELKHYLPAQSPLKDFVHHNTLHAFQDQSFFDALRNASKIFGYKVFLTLDEYRDLYQKNKINDAILEKVIKTVKPKANVDFWKQKLLKGEYDTNSSPRINDLRHRWRTLYKIDLDALVHPILFRVLCSYLDQGISIWSFPRVKRGFLEDLKLIEQNSHTSFFRRKRAKNLLLEDKIDLEYLLELLVGKDSSLYEHYLFDQQFAHQGWSGIVATIDTLPETLLDERRISLKDLIVFELLLEIDALDYQFGEHWKTLAEIIHAHPSDLFAEVETTELDEVFSMWQKAYEWSYFDQVLAAIQLQDEKKPKQSPPSFQAFLCIDDRECSFRRYIEQVNPDCETFGTPGFFGVEFYFQPEQGKFHTKVCPAPVTPKYVIKEVGAEGKKVETDLHFSKHSHSFHSAWLISQTLGFWSAVKLFFNVMRPSNAPSMASSFKHVDKYATLTIEHQNEFDKDLQVGFTVQEMATRVENLLRSVGLIKNFSPIIYMIGHGASSINNPHYAGYDCGACSGRPGSVNAKVISYMANHPKVRQILKEKGIDIPEETQFVGALHDTTNDDIMFYDKGVLSPENVQRNKTNKQNFRKALDLNAKERSRRFISVNSKKEVQKVHEEVRKRSVALFEPRPELNHATNALCIVGRRALTKNIFLDRRSFLNSYDYQTDPEGKYLLTILNAAAPVCGGINLEYYFSRVDNQKLGAGSKLPHNVMGLIGVANGIDGDLRPGLPKQMIEIHDPIRLMMIVEHYPEVVLKTIKINPSTYEWFKNGWVLLTVIHPKTKECFTFTDEQQFIPYQPITTNVKKIEDMNVLIESSHENLDVSFIL